MATIPKGKFSIYLWKWPYRKQAILSFGGSSWRLPSFDQNGAGGPPPTSRKKTGGSKYEYTKRRIEILPNLQTNCGNESSAGRIFSNSISRHSGQETPDHMRDKRRRYKRVRNKVVYAGGIGGAGSRESWEEGLRCREGGFLRLALWREQPSRA